MDTNSLHKKRGRLNEILSTLDSLLVAFSGGVDSSFLLFSAHKILGDRVLAVTARSIIHPDRETDEAVSFAERYGIRHIIFDSNELSIPEFVRNPPDRCYYCKKVLCLKLQEIASAQDIKAIAHGANWDDHGDHRPGMRAAEEMGLIAPLAESGLAKEEIRYLSRSMGLRVWDKPSMACLASRIPYGDIIAKSNLKMVGEAEKILADLHFKHFRVRHHGQIARIEVDIEEMKRFNDPDLKKEIIDKLKELGFLYVTLDLEGYVSGSLNRVLKID